MTIQRLSIDGSSSGVRDAVVSLVGAKQATPSNTNERVSITNKQCAFQPRINTIRVGQILELRNDDPMLHNTHIRKERRTFINIAQVPRGRPVRKAISKSGLLSIKCDKHKFMKGYLVAFDHPYFAITSKTGQFRIVEVPPGHQKVVVWHETLGTLTKEIIVPKRGEVSVTFEYR